MARLELVGILERFGLLLGASLQIRCGQAESFQVTCERLILR